MVDEALLTGAPASYGIPDVVVRKTRGGWIPGEQGTIAARRTVTDRPQPFGRCRGNG